MRDHGALIAVLGVVDSSSAPPRCLSDWVSQFPMARDMGVPYRHIQDGRTEIATECYGALRRAHHAGYGRV